MYHSTDYFAIARNDDATNRHCDEPESVKKQSFYSADYFAIARNDDAT